MILSAVLIVLIALFAFVMYRRSADHQRKRMGEREHLCTTEIVSMVGDQHPIIASAVFCTSVHFCNIHKREMMGKMLVEITAFAAAIVACNPAYRSKHGVTDGEARSIAEHVVVQLSIQYRESKKYIKQIMKRYCTVAQDKEPSLALLAQRALAHRPARASIDLNETEDHFDRILTEAIEGMWEHLAG